MNLDLQYRAHWVDTALELVWLIREQGTHEGRELSFEVLEKRPDTRSLLRTRYLLRPGRGSDNWASVDSFCCSVSGPVWREGRNYDKQVLSWAPRVLVPADAKGVEGFLREFEDDLRPW